MTRNDTPVQWASYLLAAAGLLAMLLHLVPAVLAGLLVYVLVGGITRRYLGSFDNRKARVWVTAAVALIIGLAIFGALSLLLSQLQVSSMQGLTGLWSKIADIVAGARDILPAWMLDSMPNSAEDIQAEVVGLLKAHTGQLQTIGKEMGIGLLHTSSAAWWSSARSAAACRPSPCMPPWRHGRRSSRSRSSGCSSARARLP